MIITSLWCFEICFLHVSSKLRESFGTYTLQCMSSSPKLLLLVQVLACLFSLNVLLLKLLFSFSLDFFF